jgi:molybdopterin synthase catalytic subunit
MMKVTLVREPIDIAALSRFVAAESNGATAVFVGTVRSSNEGRAVTGIEYSAYDEMAELELGRILDEAKARFGIADAAVEHRLGELHVGEASIGVAVGHPHRGAALDALRYIVDETKQRAPIWKLEHYADGTREWVASGTGRKP